MLIREAEIPVTKAAELLVAGVGITDGIKVLMEAQVTWNSEQPQ
ncbi:MAG: hypothetical protein ACXQT5_01140 [Candidatus Syntropharchaeia archaeon]